MHPGFDMSMPASPPIPQPQHSTNGFPHVPSISAVQVIKGEPSSPLGGYNGMQMATGVPSIFDPVPPNSIATTVMPSQAIKKEEKQVLPAVVQSAAPNKPVGDGEWYGNVHAVM
jgi:hypothetical protein